LDLVTGQLPEARALRRRRGPGISAGLVFYRGYLRGCRQYFVHGALQWALVFFHTGCCFGAYCCAV